MIPKISVCIPAYNRPEVLPALLHSVLVQDYADFEIVICEDKSPKREQIRKITAACERERPGLIRYYENERNLGYDGNLRHLIERATSEYCLFMGNDDLMCSGALKAVAAAIRKYANVGVVVRAYATFEGGPENMTQEFRYFPEERFFPAGADGIATVFRRSVVISGMTVQREAARRYATDRFDGSLLYQLWLVANIITEMNAVYLPQILTLYRTGGVPDFGSAEAERGKFVPQDQTPESSLHFMRGMLDIARAVEHERGVRVYRRILSDIGNYSYPILAIQANKGAGVFIAYWWRLAKMGFWRNTLFHGYFVALLLLGTKHVDRIINALKKRLGYTPTLGGVYKGRSS